MKTKLYASLVVSALALGLAFSGSVSASPTYCSADGAHPDDLSKSDMTWQGSNADDCYGVVKGNPPGEGDLTFLPEEDIEGTGWGTFTFLVKADDDENLSTGTFKGVEFTLTANDIEQTTDDIEQTTGEWTLSWKNVNDENPGLPITLDFVGNLKAGAGYASYLFESIAFGVDPLEGEGRFTIAFVNPKGDSTNNPDLSNLSLFARVADDPDIPDNGNGDIPIPEPATLGLLGIGLFGLGMATYRRRRLASTEV